MLADNVLAVAILQSQIRRNLQIYDRTDGLFISLKRIIVVLSTLEID